MTDDIENNNVFTPESVTLTIYNQEGTEYGVSWQTECEGEPVLEYTDEDDVEFKHSVKVDAEISEGIDIVKNSAVIKNVKNGEKCRWRVGDKSGIFSEAAVFKTLSHKENETTMLLSTDTQMDDPKRKHWEYSWKDALNRNPDIEIHLHMGDIVQYGGKKELWRDTFDVNKEIIRSCPMLPSGGNHDHYHEYLFGRVGVVSKMYNIDTVEQDKTHGIYYSVDCGPAHITVLCSGDMEKTDNNGLTESQLVWAKKDIISTDKKWKIVMIHTPLYSPGKYGSKEFLSKNPRALRRQLNEFFVENGVDIVLSGHDHLFSETYPILLDGQPDLNAEYVTEVINGEEARLVVNPKGPIHVLPGCAGDQNRSVEVDSEDDLIYFKDIVNMMPRCTAYGALHIKDNVLVIDYRMNNRHNECIEHRRFGIKKEF